VQRRRARQLFDLTNLFHSQCVLKIRVSAVQFCPWPPCKS
jgi:hypothetical protein